MKRILFILIFNLFTFTLLFSQYNQIDFNKNNWYEPDTIIYYNFFNDTIYRRITRISPENKVIFYLDDIYSNGWEMYSRSTFKYDDNGRLYYFLEELNNYGNVMNNVTDSIYYFDNKTIYVNKVWEVDHWMNNRRKVINTNNLNLPISTYKYYWDVNNKDWGENYKDTCIYNSNNLLEENIVKTKFFNEDILYKNVYTYNSNLKLTNKLYQVFDSTSLSWKNDSLYVYTYDNYGNNDTIYTKYYKNDIWVDTIIEVYTYFDNNSLKSNKHIVVDKDGNQDNIYSYYYDYDINNNIILKQKEYHNIESNEKQEWFYDSNNNCIKNTTSKLKDGEWVTTYKRDGIELYYNNMQSMMLLFYIKCYSLSWVTASYKQVDNFVNKINNNNNNSFLCYPNPTNNILNIKTNNINYKTIEIYNINGSLIYTNNMSNSIDISNLNKGIYFIRLSGDKKSEVQKIVIN